MSNKGAIADVVIERQRQQDAEGYSTHDDNYFMGELCDAAACYATVAAAQARGASAHEFTAEMLSEMSWPWDERHWKPKDARRNLVRAAALIIAEIERIDRAKISKKEKL